VVRIKSNEDGTNETKPGGGGVQIEARRGWCKLKPDWSGANEARRGEANEARARVFVACWTLSAKYLLMI